jgi:putative transposase
MRLVFIIFFQNRYKSNIIDTDLYLLNCGKYIELNPTRGGIAARPEDYPFSSFRFYCSGKKDSLLMPDPVYLALSENVAKRQEIYKEIVVDNEIISGEIMWKHRYIGSEQFKRKMEERFGLPNESKSRGRPRKRK